MSRLTLRLTRSAWLAVATVSLYPSASALAQPGPVSSPPRTSVEQTAQDASNYWTADRLARAVSKPLPEVQARPFDASDAPQPDGQVQIGLAPGWRPGRARQPQAQSRLRISADSPIAVQTTPPFTPPSSPTDYGNYAPFQRFTWQQAYNTTYPMSTVGKLFFTQRGSNYVCSASVIHRNTLATAGHCVHDGSNSNDGWSYNLLFCPSYNPTGAPLGCWGGWLATTSWYWFNAGNVDRDYGCIVTQTSGTAISASVGDITGWLGRAWNFPSRQSTFAWGYPQGAPFEGDRLITTVSTEWYEINTSNAEPQLSKYIGNDMTGGSSGGPWWINQTYGDLEIVDTDGSGLTDPAQGGSFPFLNGVNSHKRCTSAGCVAGLFSQEMGSPQFRGTDQDNNESEDVFAACFANGGV